MDLNLSLDGLAEWQLGHSIRIDLELQAENLRVLELIGVNFDPPKDGEYLTSVLDTCRNLQKFSAELKFLDDGILQAIKAHGNQHGQWNHLTFEKVTARTDLPRVKDILANHEGILGLKLDHNDFFARHHIYAYIKEIEFQFSLDSSPRPIEEILQIYSANYSVPDIDPETNQRLENLIQLVSRLNSVKFLSLRVRDNVLKDGGADYSLEPLVIGAGGLEELQFEFGHGIVSTLNVFDTVKSMISKLKRFTVEVYEENLQRAREKMKIFEDTNIQTILIEKLVKNQNVPFKRRMYSTSTCTWMK